MDCPWNLYFRVTLPDAIDLGLLDVINRTQSKNFSREQFVADCRARSGQEEIYQQAYMCNPMGASANHIVEWSAIDRCRHDYEIVRVHLESTDVTNLFGDFEPSRQKSRHLEIQSFLDDLFSSSSSSSLHHSNSPPLQSCRLGFDVAASGQGDLAAFYLDEPRGPELWLRALLTVRTEDWDFLKTVLFHFLRKLPRIKAAGDSSGLGRQICWEASRKFPNRFLPVNFSTSKHDLGFSLMNQLSMAEKRFPRSHQDIAADFFALRKNFNGNRWNFRETANPLNPASHCDIAWAAALASAAHAWLTFGGATVLNDPPRQPESEEARVRRLVLSDEPGLWRSGFCG